MHTASRISCLKAAPFSDERTFTRRGINSGFALSMLNSGIVSPVGGSIPVSRAALFLH